MNDTEPEKSWKYFFDKYVKVREKVSEDGQKNADGFSIFEVLDIEQMERETHSAFLANLLDPYGSHGQGELFLREFLKYVKEKIERRNKAQKGFEKEIAALKDLIKAANIKSQYTARKWHITTEKHIGKFGRLDIYVKNESAILIENKIGSDERDGQLKKYSDWRDEHKCVGILLYLTLDGREPQKSTLATYKYHRPNKKLPIK